MPCSRASLALALEPRVGVLRTKSNSNSKLLRNLGQDLNLDFGVARYQVCATVTVHWHFVPRFIVVQLSSYRRRHGTRVLWCG